MSQRRILGGARREASERVLLVADQSEIEGWTLNLSRGGLRVVVEDEVVPGSEYRVAVGESEPRAATVVWVREESDGTIAGLAYVDGEATIPPSSV